MLETQFSGDKLRRRRAGCGFTQGKLADRLGVNYTTLWKWENGWYEPSLRNQIRLAQVLRCRVTDFYVAVEPGAR